MRSVLFFLLILLCVACSQTTITTYYVDSTNGDDSAKGTSPEKAWKSLEKIRTVKLEAGDKILLKKGETFNGELHITAKGQAGKPIVIDGYGDSAQKPCIKGNAESMYAVYIFNSEYVEIKNLEIVNQGKERLAGRTGIKIHTKDYGVSSSILIKGLDVHDVNGSLVKSEGGGSGILLVNEGNETPSYFDGLTIEDCTVRRCERNAMIWSGYWHRDNWHPNLNVVVRNNLIEEVPGDGIVPIGCDGALIEYNVMRNCPALLPDTEAAAGMWPWSCDNTIIRFNEASDHKAPWDAQGFDSDYNCTNTTIQYNYSHDNEGGFLLICDAGGDNKNRNIGNIGTRIRYNISINDAIRTRQTRVGTFSPTIHIAGPCENTLVEYNILHANKKPEGEVDHSILTADSWNGYANNTTFRGNIFHVAQLSAFRMTESTNNSFIGNIYLGDFINKPDDPKSTTTLASYNELLEKDPTGFQSLYGLMETRKIAGGQAEITTVNKEAIESFFTQIPALQ